MNRILIIIAAVVALGLTGLTVLNLSPANRAVASQVTAQTNEVTQTFAVEHMTCPACPFTVKKAMARVGGVISVTVDFAAIKISLDPVVTTGCSITNIDVKTSVSQYRKEL